MGRFSKKMLLTAAAAVTVLFTMMFIVSCTGSDDGVSGPPGANGTAGKDGKDGTEITIGDNGNWFIDGVDTGLKAEGADGIDGTDGTTPLITIGTNGNWLINGADTGVKAAGEQGASGADGKDGSTPLLTIGTNGNWFINGTDTGIKAAGEQGSSGANGTDGADGQGCNAEEDGAYFVMMCGEVESARWAKALCGTTAYDPDGNRFCVGVTLHDKCNGEVYSLRNQFCVGMTVYDKCGGEVYSPENQYCDGTIVHNKLTCGNNQYFPSTQFCDERDDKIYKFVEIDAQTWMAENLNYAGPDNDIGACYDGETNNCDIYGRLYDWAAVMAETPSSSATPSGVQGICPAGWHVPSDGEWTGLTEFVGVTAGTKLKSTSGWNDNGNGTDDFGFSALPGGYGSNGSFDFIGDDGYWWSATESNASRAWYRNMFQADDSVNRNNIDKTNLYSVRCVRD